MNPHKKINMKFILTVVILFYPCCQSVGSHHNCGNYTRLRQGNCYKYYKARIQYEEAVRQCNKEDATLVEIDNHELLVGLVNMVVRGKDIPFILHVLIYIFLNVFQLSLRQFEGCGSHSID